MEIKVALTNLGKYNEGELVYEWVTLPIEIERNYMPVEDSLKGVLKRIGIGEPRFDGGVYEEYFISDYEAPFEIGEYESLSKLNDMAMEMECLDDEQQEAMAAYMEEVSGDFTEALEVITHGDYLRIDGCNDMTDVAYYYIDELHAHEIPGFALRYFDYEKFGRDLSFDGVFAFRDGYCYEFPL